MATRGKTSTMSADHKAALADGRRESHVVRAYLEALEAHRPRRGRKRTVDSVRRRLTAVATEITTADPLTRLQLVQEQLDLAVELAAFNATVDLAALEAEFVAAAKAYSDRKGISYAAWRAVGVAPAVLKQAGITRRA